MTSISAKRTGKKIITMAEPYFSPDDQAAVLEQVPEILSKQLSMGPNVVAFQNEFAKHFNVPYAVGVNACTSALEIAIRYLNISPGDEVIVPGQTFIATGMAPYLNGATLRFAEINPKTFSLDVRDVERKITDKTKAVIIVHFSGYISPEILELKEICQSKNILLIEDAAHTPGGQINGKFAGSIGDVGCFSFYPTKILTTGEGGMLTTSSPELHAFARSLQNRGRDMDSKQELYLRPGRNIRMAEFNALLGRVQLKTIDENLASRRKNAALYLELFSSQKNINCLPKNHLDQSAWWKFPLLLDNDVDRDAVLETLNEQGIQADNSYSPPLHLQPVFKDLGIGKKGMLPITESVMSHHLCLPCHPRLSEEDIRYVADQLITAVHQ